MNDAEFEKNLRQLRPAQPSADLKARIRRDLLAPDVLPEKPVAERFAAASLSGLFLRLLRDFGWACAGAAAVLVVLALLHGWPRSVSTPTAVATAAAANPKPVEAAEPAAFEHDETTHDLVSTEGSDEVIETDEGPAREVRYSYVERHAWSNPQTGARVVLEVPREDVYLVPISLQ
jgi:hypothetical protein